MKVEFYKELLSFRTHSKSPKQIEFRDWLREYIETHYQNITTDLDAYGNLYIQKGNQARTVNCVIAHLDINQRTITDDIEIMQINDWILGVDRGTGKQIGLGHDDKTGVYFCLQALARFKNIKVFFPLDEEIGCLGSKASNADFFDNVGFMLQLDRRGKGDISIASNGNDLLTKDMQTELEPILADYDYKFIRTVSTDVGFLVGALDIQGTNISCGYYNEHSNEEVLNTVHYDNAEQFGFALLRKTSGKKYPIAQKKYVPVVYNNYKSSSTNSVSQTNSSVGKPLTVIIGGKMTNDNTHLFEKEEMDSYKGSAQYVTDIDFEDCSFDTFGDVIESAKESARVTLTKEQKSNNFRILWQNRLEPIDIAKMNTDELIDGYKALVAWFVKETQISDNEILDTLDGLLEEVNEVSYIGFHDLSDVEVTIKHFKNLINSYYEDATD